MVIDKITNNKCHIFCSGSKTQSGSGSSSCLNGSTSSQAFGVKSSIRVGNAASNSVESSGGALAHEGAGTSGTTATSTGNPSVSAATANPPLSNSTHKHLLRSRVKLSSDQSKDWPSKISGKHHKKDSSSSSCSSSR